jgi:hypothetical protein
VSPTCFMNSLHAVTRTIFFTGHHARHKFVHCSLSNIRHSSPTTLYHTESMLRC